MPRQRNSRAASATPPAVTRERRFPMSDESYSHSRVVLHDGTLTPPGGRPYFLRQNEIIAVHYP